jgi:hypothetical protein
MEIDELISRVIVKKMGKILLKALVKPTEILNLFSPRSFSFFNFTLLNSSGKTPAEPFNN